MWFSEVRFFDNRALNFLYMLDTDLGAVVCGLPCEKHFEGSRNGTLIVEDSCVELERSFEGVLWNPVLLPQFKDPYIQ